MNKEIIGVFQDDPKISSADIEQIEILSENTSSQKWNELVSIKNRHFMQMQDDEWPSKIVNANQYWYSWENDWNNNNFSEFKILLKGLEIPEKNILYVFWMREIALKTNWGVFCNNWANFLYEDEGCILVLPNHNKSMILSNGLAWQGMRCVLKT